MSNFKELAFTALLYAAAIAVGIVAAKLAHGLYTGATAASTAAPTS